MTSQKTTSGNPFFDFDVTKILAGFDPAKAVAEFTKAAEKFNPAGLNVDTLLEAQRRNIEAITAANQVAVEGAKAIAQRQVKILEQSLGTAKKSMDDIGKAASPQDATLKQAEIAKKAFEKAIADSKQLTTLAEKSNTEAGEVIARRISEGLDEIQELAKTFRN